jgi:hypothetical protein
MFSARLLDMMGCDDSSLLGRNGTYLFFPLLSSGLIILNARLEPRPDADVGNLSFHTTMCCNVNISF